MLPGYQPFITIEQNKTGISTRFIIICFLTFIISIIATIYFYSPMCCDMKMPGGWTMSMMWMTMPGKTWGSLFFNFQLMWAAMMVVMMMPSAFPMFMKIKKRWSYLSCAMSGYFVVWVIAGIPVYILGITLADAAMQSESLSKAVPLLSGATLVLAGLYQFSSLKMTNLLHCRSSFGCAILNLQHKTGFYLGCKQGIACCICCSALMIVQVVLGIMNPVVMIIVAIAITIEKLLPRPDITVRIFGVSLFITGFLTALRWLITNII